MFQVIDLKTGKVLKTLDFDRAYEACKILNKGKTRKVATVKQVKQATSLKTSGLI